MTVVASAPASRPLPLAGTEPLIDVHAHFLHAGTGRSESADTSAAAADKSAAGS